MKRNDVALVDSLRAEYGVWGRGFRGVVRQTTSTNLQCLNQNYEYLYSVVYYSLNKSYYFVRSAYKNLTTDL
jgi:hypothetical protein